MDVVLFYHGENHQVLLRVLPSDPQAGREPVVWNLSPEEIPPAPEFTCIDETAIAEKSPEATTTFLYRDDFEGALAPGWNWIREEEEQWSLTERHGFMRFIFESAYYPRNLLLRPAPEGDFEISTRVLFTPSSNFQFAGLLIYQDDDNNIRLGRAYAFFDWDPDRFPGNAIYFGVDLQGKSGCPNFITVTDSESEAYLKIRREGNLYSAYYSRDGISWTLTGQHVAELESISIGLFAGQSGVTETADFDYFLIETLP
jgi:beta-xylosidase